MAVGAGLLIQSFIRLSNVNPGFNPDGVLTFQLSLPPDRPDAELRAVAQALTERIQSLAGVRAVGYAESLPMTRVSRRMVSLRRYLDCRPHDNRPQHRLHPTIPTRNS